MGILDILILTGILFLALLALRRLRRNGGGRCCGCPMAGRCGKEEKRHE